MIIKLFLQILFIHGCALPLSNQEAESISYCMYCCKDLSQRHFTIYLWYKCKWWSQQAEPQHDFSICCSHNKNNTTCHYLVNTVGNSGLSKIWERWLTFKHSPVSTTLSFIWKLADYQLSLLSLSVTQSFIITEYEDKISLSGNRSPAN